jgi:hypothetical protein
MLTLVRWQSVLPSLVVACWATLVPPAARGEDELLSAPRRPSRRFDADLVNLVVDGHRAFVLMPRNTGRDAAPNWVWYAPTLLAPHEEDWKSPGQRHAWLFNRLTKGGLCVAGVDVGESYGSPQGRATYDRFYELLVERHGFGRRPGLLAISRGGLMAYNWAAEHPTQISCIGGIYPVCNLRAYPRMDRLTGAYGMSADQLRAQFDKHNPLARLQPLAGADVPILHLHGDQDKAVPLEEHSAELARRYRALGGNIEVTIVEGKGHEVVPEFWQHPGLVDFFLRHADAR